MEKRAQESSARDMTIINKYSKYGMNDWLVREGKILAQTFLHQRQQQQ